MARWRKAKSLVVLDNEIENHYPGTTIWDIGDEDHRNGWSDHNANECCDVVCADDILSDGGLDLQKLADHLVAHPHPNLRYVIFNRKIYQRKNGFKSQDYNGKNAHETHVHVSVGNGPDGRSTGGYDDTSSWRIAEIDGKPSKPGNSKPSVPKSDWTQDLIMALPTLRQGARGSDVKRLQALLAANGYAPRKSFDSKGRPDGIFQDGTGDALEAFQEGEKVKNSVNNGKGDRIAGRYTWTELLGE